LSHSTSTGSRPFTPLTLYVAIFIRPSGRHHRRTVL
jgi:hypothetical protein